MEIRLSARNQWEDSDSPAFLDKTFIDSRITIGNNPAASLCLNGSVLSPEQVVIVNLETGPKITNQAEGTFLNGEMLALNESRLLKDGDLLDIGTYRISVFLADEPAIVQNDPGVPGNDIAAKLRNVASQPQVGADHPEELLTATGYEPERSRAELTDPFLTNSNHRSKPAKSFGAILDSLRTDEDRFYFVIDGGYQSGVHIPIELEEMPLGWDETGQYLCFDISSIADLSAVVHKDWSGVICRTQTTAHIAINDEPLAGDRRLRDGDRLLLRGPAREAVAAAEVVLVFREPTSLVILDSLMPRVQPPREDAASQAAQSTLRGDEARARKPGQKLATLIRSDREYFSAFTFVELSLMAIGTIAGAFIIFLILNYS